MRTAHRSVHGTESTQRAFTLIELMVVVLIISLLLAILLPALRGAKQLGAQVKEMAAGQQKLIAWSHYAYENKEAAFTGYIPWAAGHLYNAAGQNVWLHPDPWVPGRMVEGNVIKMNGLRWMGATGMTLDELQIHKPTADSFRNRPNVAALANGAPPTTLYDSSIGTLAAAMAFHPSLGMNTTYVGGNWHRGAMQGYTVGGGMGHPRPRKWYVTHLHEVRRSDALMVFSSARGVDIAGTGTFGSTSWGRNPAPFSAASIVVPGYWEVVPPRVGFPQNAPDPMGAWVVSNKFDPIVNPRAWGFVDPRHNTKAVTVMVDGHVELQGLAQLRDMRRWANKATSPDWNFVP